jgi:hypothetical protein
VAAHISQIGIAKLALFGQNQKGCLKVFFEVLHVTGVTPVTMCNTSVKKYSQRLIGGELTAFQNDTPLHIKPSSTF